MGEKTRELEMGSSAAPACTLFSGLVFGVELDDPFLILPSFLAFCIGVTCGRLLWKQGAYSHAVPFFGFATMMSEAAVTHCAYRYFNAFGQSLIMFIDAFLTSSIALAFFLIALEDLGWLSKKRYGGVLFLADLPIFLGWAWAFFISPSPAHQQEAFRYLYLVEIAVCCGVFGIVQIHYIIKGRFEHGLTSLLLALVAGAIGMKTIFICSWPSVRFSGQFWWFLLSDVAMFFVYRYFRLRAGSAEQ